MIQPRRIAFCGASGTGKSTLAEWVRETAAIPLNPVGSRSVAKAMGFESPYDVDAAGKRGEFQKQLLDAKLAWEAAHEEFVTDRALFDNLTYTALHDVRSITDEAIDRTMLGFERYTHVFFCPVSAFIKTGDDPQRIHERAYHRIFEMLLVGGWRSLAGRGRHIVTLETSDLLARKQIVRLEAGI